MKSRGLASSLGALLCKWTRNAPFTGLENVSCFLLTQICHSVLFGRSDGEFPVLFRFNLVNYTASHVWSWWRSYPDVPDFHWGAQLRMSCHHVTSETQHPISFRAVHHSTNQNRRHASLHLLQSSPRVRLCWKPNAFLRLWFMTGVQHSSHFHRPKIK